MPDNSMHAFPWADPNTGNGAAGMTLRQHYAGQALAGMCQACGWQGGDFKRMAKHAVEAADELLAALARGGSHE